jgi:DNA-binding transcriptional regulator YiaG
MEFSEKVKCARKVLNLTQQELATKLNVSFATVNRWEKGHSVPNFYANNSFNDFCKANNIEFKD